MGTNVSDEPAASIFRVEKVENFFHSEDYGSRCLWNIDAFIPDYEASHCKGS
jgi:hypothetical protein